MIAIAPEIFVGSMACIVLLVGVFCKNQYSAATYILSLLTLVGALLITFVTMPVTTVMLYANSFIVDRFSHIFKIILCLLLASIFIYSHWYTYERKFFQGEFFALSLFSLLGMMVLISSANFLTLYLGLELFILPIYAMIVLVKDHSRYIEAAIKYFIIGSLGSGLLLYGISLIYGGAGSISFATIASATTPNPLLLQLGMIFVVVGIALEFGAVPFHMWLPDVYEGSPTTVTMIIGTISKMAVFAAAYRLLTLAFVNLNTSWQEIFMVLAIISVFIGNFMAIAQINIKRMLAYSTISHIAFILLGMFVAPNAGFQPAIFYTVVYTFMALAAFAVIIYLSNLGFEAELITDFRGLNQRAPWLAFIMLLIMFSLAGVPPLVGFYAKLQILQAVVNAGYSWLAILALLASVIGAFYYLRVVREMYFVAPQRNVAVIGNMSVIGKALLYGHGLALLIFGIYPGAIVYLCLTMLR